MTEPTVHCGGNGASDSVFKVKAFLLYPRSFPVIPRFVRRCPGKFSIPGDTGIGERVIESTEWTRSFKERTSRETRK